MDRAEEDTKKGNSCVSLFLRCAQKRHEKGGVPPGPMKPRRKKVRLSPSFCAARRKYEKGAVPFSLE